MRNRIFGAIGVLWGGLIVLRWLLADSAGGTSSAYQAGQNGAVLFGLLMFVIGIYYVFKKSG